MWLIPGYYFWLAYQDTFRKRILDRMDEQDFWAEWKDSKVFLFFIALFLESVRVVVLIAVYVLLNSLY